MGDGGKRGAAPCAPYLHDVGALGPFAGSGPSENEDDHGLHEELQQAWREGERSGDQRVEPAARGTEAGGGGREEAATEHTPGREAGLPVTTG